MEKSANQHGVCCAPFLLSTQHETNLSISHCTTNVTFLVLDEQFCLHKCVRQLLCTIISNTFTTVCGGVLL